MILVRDFSNPGAAILLSHSNSKKDTGPKVAVKAALLMKFSS